MDGLTTVDRMSTIVATDSLSFIFYSFMVLFCLRNIKTIFWQQKNKNPLLIMFYVTSFVCVFAAWIGFFDYLVLDVLVLRGKVEAPYWFNLADESLQLWIYFKLLLGLGQSYSMFELADYVLIDPTAASGSKLRCKVITAACSFAVLILGAYFYVAVQMGLSTNDMERCAKVYSATEYFTAVFFFLVSVGLTVAYCRLSKAINKCVFPFDTDTT